MYKYFNNTGSEVEGLSLEEIFSFLIALTEGYGNGLVEGNNDRHIGFSTLFKYMSDNFVNPKILETGCLRIENNWKGDGQQTFLVGFYVKYNGGDFTTVDIDFNNLDVAKKVCKDFPVKYLCQDSKIVLEEYAKFPEPFLNVLLLDSQDTEVPGYDQHCLQEAIYGDKALTKKGIILIDDTVKVSEGIWKGKGRLAIPWLLEHGWKILHQGYQTILIRK